MLSLLPVALFLAGLAALDPGGPVLPGRVQVLEHVLEDGHTLDLHVLGGVEQLHLELSFLVDGVPLDVPHHNKSLQ